MYLASQHRIESNPDCLFVLRQAVRSDIICPTGGFPNDTDTWGGYVSDSSSFEAERNH